MSDERKRRMAGTGTVRDDGHGRYEAYLPKGHGHSQRRLGVYDTYDEADAALAERLGFEPGSAFPPVKQAGRPRRTMTPEAVEDMKRARARTDAINRFLDDMRAERLGGRSVALGRLEGFPSQTEDPDVVDRAAAVIAARIPHTRSAVTELAIRQRVIDLRAAADRLRAVSNGAADRAVFIEHGAAWATERGFTYAAFRELGIPADVLKEAGIARG